jgi:ABC-type phosphate transport system auxiliary subunit
MKNTNRLSMAGMAAALFVCLTPPLAQAAEKPHTHSEALHVEAEDPVLKEQIVKVTQVLDQLHHEMAKKRQAIHSAANDAQKSASYAELDVLNKEHDMLEQLLHDLVKEAHATEWTIVDEALRRVKKFEQRQEQEYRQEEALRDRKE